MPLEPKDNDSGKIGRRICVNVGEIEIERHQHSAFKSRSGREHRILGSGQVLTPDGVGFEAGIIQDRGALKRQVLINL